MTGCTSRRLRWITFSAAFVTLAAIGVVAKTASATVDWQQKVDASVLDAAALGGGTEFFIYLDEQADLSGAGALRTKAAKGRYVYDRLRATAQDTQGPVIAALDQLGAEHRSFWVTNAILAEGGLAAVEAVARLPEVEHVYPVGAGRLEPPVPVNVPGGTTSTNLTATVFDSIAKVNADDAWALGYRGQGAVVGGADTGVRWTHEAIKSRYRGWNGVTASHDHNWHDAIHVPDPSNVCGATSPTPCDDDTLLGGGHGTHTVGTMVGKGPDRLGQKNEIGMAPDAQWIACRNMAHGLGAIPTYFECMQWFIAPTKVDGTGADPAKAPDVVNNSWGCVEVCPPPALQDALRASRAAGIFYAVSAGNDGIGGPGPAAGCNTIYHPLARYPEAFTVGATTWTTDTIADFSSRGPVVLGDAPNQVLMTKPNITAPGETIRSALRATDSSYGNLSGTSMAGPHAAGLVALIISANSALRGDVDQIEDIIEATAAHKTTSEGCGLDSATQVPNNTYGWGRIDALAAVELAVALRNHAPVAADDAATLDQGGAVWVDVLANDIDVDGDDLTIVSFGQGARGTVTGSGGTLRYAHDGSAAGPDSFTYTVSDGRGGSDTATVAVTVLSPAQTVTSVAAELDAVIAASPAASADKLEDARAKLQTALSELGKSPPARQAALGALEGAVGELEAAVEGRHLGSAQGATLMNRVAGAARQVAVDAIAAARARGGSAAGIAAAEQSLAQGDGQRAAGAYKAAVSRYRDALSKAESA